MYRHDNKIYFYNVQMYLLYGYTIETVHVKQYYDYPTDYIIIIITIQIHRSETWL